MTICSYQTVAQKQFEVEDLRSDIDFMQAKYERSHPNLYRYTSKDELNHVFDSLRESITEPMTEIDFYNHIRVLSLYIRDGHSVLTLSKETLKSHFNKKKFPFEIEKWDERFFIKDNYSSDSLIERGDELLSINGLAIREVFETIKNRQSADGFNQTFPIWSTLNWFMAKYGLNFGYPEKFELELVGGETDKKTTKEVDALTVDSMRVYYSSRYQKLYEKPASGRGIYLHQINDSLALLKVKTFSSSILRKRYKQKFRKSIRSIFHKLENSKTSKLLIDLRGNLGGESTNGNFLLSHLIKKPYNMLEFTDMMRRNKRNGEERRIQNKGLRWRIRMAKKWNKSIYEGKLFMLIDGGSFSCSGIVASNLDRFTNCTFLGEETGGNGTRMSGAGDQSKLPSTKIRMKVPVTRYTIRPIKSEFPTGVIPNVIFDLTKKETLSYRDEWLLKSIEYMKNH